MKIKVSWIAFACLLMGLWIFNVLQEYFQTPATEVPSRHWITLLGSLLFVGSGIILQEQDKSRSFKYGLITISFGLLLIVASFVLGYSRLGWTGTTLITLGMVATASFGTLFMLYGLWLVQSRRHRRSKMV